MDKEVTITEKELAYYKKIEKHCEIYWNRLMQAYDRIEELLDEGNDDE
jgi:hypothetical protein